jgi:hypothetical protein
LAIPELELEAALLGGWVRFWFRGELLPLPGDLLKRLTDTEQQLTDTKRQLTDTKRRLTATEKLAEAERQARLEAEAELSRLREELARARGQQP